MLRGGRYIRQTESTVSGDRQDKHPTGEIQNLHRLIFPGKITLWLGGIHTMGSNDVGDGRAKITEETSRITNVAGGTLSLAK